MKNKKWLILIIIGIILICIAACLLIHKQYIDKRAGEQSHKVLEQIEKQLKEETTKEEITIDGNEYIGIITIPSLNLELPVMSDWSYPKMKISPTRYYGDQKTNDLVICAHSYKSLFRYIKDLNKEDILIYKDMSGTEYIYQVEVVEILKPEQIKEMIESEFDLTLFTCTNDNQDRVTVRFNQVIK